MLKNVFAWTPINGKWLSIYASIALLVCLLIFPTALHLHLTSEFEERSSYASTALQKKMQTIFSELKNVVDEANVVCSDAHIKHLQRATFYSSLIKGYGLFDENYKVYCTSDGPTDFYIFNSIIEEIEANPKNITVSLVRSKNLGEPTVFAFYVGDKGIGANALVSPEDLTEEVAWWLTEDFPYQLKVGEKLSSSHKDFSQLNVLANKQIDFVDWSLTLDIVLPKTTYWKYMYGLFGWILGSWLALTLLLRGGHLLVEQYRCSLAFSLKKAIKNGQLAVHYQPIITLNSHEVYEMEALIRWDSPYHGSVPALKIIELSERLGLMDQLTWIVVRKVGELYRQHSTSLQNIRTSVNVDRHTLLHENFLFELEHILKEYPELIGKLGLEVTENSIISDNEMNTMVERLGAIKALGIHLSVDDIGTSYSGLDFFSRFPYDTLKLDQVFIASLGDDQYAQQILVSVIQTAKDLNMGLVAEGVEREDQLAVIASLGVGKVQGYYFSRPLDEQRILAWIEGYEAGTVEFVLSS
ncbi:EAL domain-containing protein [Marinomonas sp.]